MQCLPKAVGVLATVGAGGASAYRLNIAETGVN